MNEIATGDKAVERDISFGSRVDRLEEIVVAAVGDMRITGGGRSLVRDAMVAGG